MTYFDSGWLLWSDGVWCLRSSGNSGCKVTYFDIGWLGKLPKKKNFFGGNLSQMWDGGVADSQTRSKPLKITPKIAFFDTNFTFRFPKSHKNPGVVGWVNRFEMTFPKKTVLFSGGSPYLLYKLYNVRSRGGKTIRILRFGWVGVC